MKTYRDMRSIPAAQKRLLPVLLTMVVIISGCTTTPENNKIKPTEPASDETTVDVNDLLDQAVASTEPEASRLRMRASWLAWQNNALTQSEAILALVDKSALTPELYADYVLISAGMALQRGDDEGAAQRLTTTLPDNPPLSARQQVMAGKLRAELFANQRRYLSAAEERVYINGLLDQGARQQNHDEIIALLLRMPTLSLRNEAKQARTNEMRGWLSLALMTREFEHQPERQLRELERWRRMWTGHPAAQYLPTRMQMLAGVVATQPKVVAILLPLQGDFGVAGRAIRDGIIAAHYADLTETEVMIFDTASGREIPELLNRAIDAGAELIIGPLIKENVAAITRTQVPIPVLALNRSETPVSDPLLFQFGLAPEDEVLQVANQIHRDGLDNIIVMAPEGPWGDRNLDTFAARWVELGGNVVEISRFNEDTDNARNVKTLLKVDESEARAAQLKRITNTSMEFTPRRRKDFDAVLLLANPPEARIINPALDFYYAEDIPVYATSHVHQRSDSRIDSIDLNGIRFCEIPWKLTSTGELQSDVQALWPASRTGLARFYALGIDAHRIAPRLAQMQQISTMRLFGMTGLLNVQDNVVHRELMWGQFANGEVVTMPMIVSER